MIIDRRLEFSTAQALTATAASTNQLDFGQDRDIGPGQPMWIVVVSRAAPGGTSPTIAISVETDDNAGFSSAATLATHPTLAAAAFGAGTIVVIPMPFTNERFLQLRYTLGGTSPTFTVDAFLTSEDPRNIAQYPDAI